MFVRTNLLVKPAPDHYFQLLDRHMVERSDLIDRLNGLLRDDNPTVVASALASLMDIWERSDAIKLTIDYSNASKMVAILPDCSE